MFTGIVMSLVVIILLAKAWLVPAGQIEVIINGQKNLQVSAGSFDR